jgi:hypothetical protein
MRFDSSASVGIVQRLRCGALVALCLLFAGCGTQLLYNRLDTLISFYVSTQVSLEPGQSASLKSALRDFLSWHRRSELPRYAEFAESLARDAAAPLGRARIDQARAEVEALWRGSVARGAPAAARWLAGLSTAQIDELFASFAEDDDDLREEYCEASEQQRDREREKAFISATQDWVGRLSPAQRALVRERLAALVPSSCGWVESRQLVRAALRATVETQRGQQGFEAQVANLLTHPEDSWRRDYRLAFDANREAIVSLLAELDASFSEQQRARLAGRLLGFAADFHELAGAPAAPMKTAR